MTILNQIPAWVYILFIYLVYIGVKQCYTTVVQVKRFFILPVLFLYLSVHSLYAIMLHNPLAILMLILGIAGASVLGAYYVRNRFIRADKQHTLIEIPGDWTALVLIMAIFILKFFINYSIDADAAYVTQLSFILCTSFFSGLAIGFSSGRNGMYYWKYLHAPSTTLKK